MRFNDWLAGLELDHLAPRRPHRGRIEGTPSTSVDQLPAASTTRSDAHARAVLEDHAAHRARFGRHRAHVRARAKRCAGLRGGDVERAEQARRIDLAIFGEMNGERRS